MGKRAGEPDSGGFARWKHVVLHCIHIEDDDTYRELIDRVALMGDVCGILALNDDELPEPSTVCTAFVRYRMWGWRQLLRASADQLPTSGHGAIDGTYVQQSHPSYHYRRRSDRSIQTLKATVLADSQTQVVLDVQPSAKWRHDTAVGPQVARRNAGDLQSLAADNGDDDNSFRAELRRLGVRPLVKHRLSAAYDHAHNARLDDELTISAGPARRAFRRSSVRTTASSAPAVGTARSENASARSPSTTSNAPPQHRERFEEEYVQG